MLEMLYNVRHLQVFKRNGAGVWKPFGLETVAYTPENLEKLSKEVTSLANRTDHDYRIDAVPETFTLLTVSQRSTGCVVTKTEPHVCQVSAADAAAPVKKKKGTKVL